MRRRPVSLTSRVLRRRSCRLRLSIPLALGLSLCPGGEVRAGSIPTVVGLSFDQATATGSSGVLADEEVLYLLDDGTEFPVLAGLTSEFDLDAFEAHFDGPIVSTTTHADLGGLVVEPGDVAQVTPGGPVVLFDASAAGLVDVDVDAVARDSSGDLLLLSFAGSVPVDGGVADDEDVVRWTGSDLVLSLDASAAGVPTEADVDGIHWDEVGSRLWLTFDTTVSLGGLVIDDEDVVAWDAGSGWTRILDTSTRIPGVEESDVDALWGQTIDDQGIFADGFESGDSSAW